MFKRSPLSRPLSLTLFAVGTLAAVAYYPVAKIGAAGTAAKVLSSAPRPLVKFKTPQLPRFTYAGDAAAVAALNGGTANATALAAGDFNADGAMDVVAGYSTGKNGGVLALFHGNPDAFAPTDQTLYSEAMQGKVPPTFLPTASAFSLPESPDILLTGDFNGDGKKDVLVAARGGSLYLLLGDGHGSISAPQPVALADQVTAVAVTPDGHAAVSTDGRSGPQVTILAPGAAGLTAMQTYPLPARGESAAWGLLGGGVDLAVSAGSKIVLIYGALTSHPQRETVAVPFQIRALTLGNFIWDREARTEIAVLAEDGSIHILQHGALNTTPLTAAEIPGRRAAIMAQRRSRTKSGTVPNPTGLGAWTLAKQLPYSGSSPSGPLSASAFHSPRLSSSSTSDLMLVDAQHSQLHILDTSGKTASPSADILFPSTPVAALALPQTIDSGRDVVVLTSSQAAPTLIHAVPLLTLTVNSTSDSDPIDACSNSGVTSIPGTLTLREAVCLANNIAQTTTINLPSGTYTLGNLTDAGTGQLLVETSGTGYSLTISGAGSIIQQSDGFDRILLGDYAFVGGNPITIEGVTLQNGNCSTGNSCSDGGGAVLVGGMPDDPFVATNVVVTNNSAPTSGGSGGGGLNSAGSDFTITNSTLSKNISGSTGFNTGGGAYYQDYPPAVEGTVTITNSSFTGNISGLEGGGIYAQLDTGYPMTVTGSTFTGNQVTTSDRDGGGIYVGQYEDGAATSVTVSNARIVGNTEASGSLQPATGVAVANDTVANLANNWWGCNGGPGSSGCDSVYIQTSGSYTPVLTLSLSAGSSQVATGGSTSLTAKLMDGGTCTGYSGNACYVPDGTGVTFSGSLGAVNPSSTSFSSGSATSTFLAGNSSGTASVSAVVDNQTVSTNISIGTPPTITSGNAATFAVGTNGSFTVTTSGSPAASVSESGSLPSGVSFVNNGNGTATISGTPNPGTGGQYGFNITAQNGYSPNAMQSFTLTVDQAPTINSSNHTTFSLGSSGSFTVTTAAGTYPSSTTFSESGSLPNGVNFSNSGVLSGTPTQAGSFPITITAANGISPNATQSFTLTVSQGSTSISVNTVNPSSEAYGQDASITITAVLSWTGTGPAPSASNVVIEGNGQTGSYSATSCGAPVSDTITCSATYTPSGADTVGTYTENAEFVGDSNYGGSGSAQTNNFSIMQATSSTSVGSSVNPSIVGQPVTFTATIDGQYGLVVKRNGVVIGGGGSKKGASGLRHGASTQKGQAHPADTGFGGTVTWSSNTGCSPSTVSGDPGTAQCVTSTLGQGTDTIMATYSGDTNHSGSSATLSGGQVVNPAVTPTSIAVTGVSPSSEVYGQDAQITITAVLTWTGNGPAPTAGNVTIGGNGLGGYGATSCGSPSGDSLTCQATYTPTGDDTGGSYTETASFSGDSNYSGSSSSQTNNFSITQATSSTSVGSSQNPSIVGQPVTFTATIDGQYGLVVKRNGAVISGGVSKQGASRLTRSRPSALKPVPSSNIGGTVTWSSNTGCSPSTVSGDPGTAQCVTSTLPQGVDTITATYSGDGNHSGSTGTLSGGQQVNSAPAITSANNTSFTLNAANSFLVTTSGYPAPSLSESGMLPNGVMFVDNHNGTGTLSGTPTVGGTFPITFTASNGVGSAAMQSFTLTVTGSKTTTTLVSDRNPADTGQLVVFTATVTSTAGTPTGTVKFLNGLNVLGTANLIRGKASIYLHNLPYGTDVITATYEGNSSYNGSTSSPLNEVVYETTTTAIQSSSNPSAYDQMVTFTATVSSAAGAPPNGEMITFQSGQIFLGSAPLSGGKASVTTSVLPRETDRVVATYAGDSNFASSTGTVVQVVDKASTNTSLLSSPNPSNYHQAVVFTVSVTTEYGGTAVGTVTLMDGSKNLGMFPLNNGTVSVTISNLSVGTHNITATFEGDSFYTSSTSSPLMQTVN